MSIREFIGALSYKVKLNLKSEVALMKFHFLWWIINPLLNMLVFYFLFAVVMHRASDNYMIFLLIGIVHWEFFAKVVQESSFAIVVNQKMLTQVFIPLPFFSLEVVLKEFFKFLIGLTLLFLFIFLSGLHFTISYLYYPLVLFVFLIFVTGSGLFVSAIVPFFPDLKLILDNIIRLMFFGSGVFWSLNDIVSPKYKTLLMLNPVAGLLEQFRNVLLKDQMVDFNYLMWCFGLGIVLIVLSNIFFIKFRVGYSELCYR